MLASQLAYLLSVARIESKSLITIQSHIMKFLWRGRPPKVAKSTITLGIEKGGLKAPDLLIMNKASRIAWIGRLFRLKDLTFVQVLESKIHSSLEASVRSDFDKKWISSRQIPAFYKEMFIWFNEIHQFREPKSGKAIRMQSIWHNMAVKVQGRALVSKSLIETGAPLIDDFVGNDGSILTHLVFCERHPGLSVNPLTYLGWCRAIPPRWRRTLIGSVPLTADERSAEPVLVIKEKEVPITCIRSCYFYATLLPENIPTAQRRWEAEGVNFDWGQIYALPFKTSQSTKLQSLQYRITHRYFPTRKYLCIRQITDDPFCDNCGEVETIEHYFFLCSEITSFWRDIICRIRQFITDIGHISFPCYNIIFGSPLYPRPVNLILFLAKQYIAMQKYDDGPLCIQGFRTVLLKMFIMEKTIAIKNDKMEKFREQWKPFVNENNVFVF